MKQKSIVLILVLFLLMSVCFPVYAADSRLVDEAGLLADADRAALVKQLDELSTRYGVDVVIVTADSIGYSSPMEYADDYFDYHDYGADGVLLLISMEDRDWWISTTGYGIEAFTDAGISYIGEQMLPALSDGEYAEAFAVYADLCDEFLARAESGSPFDIYDLPKEPFRPIRSLGTALVIGLIAAFLATGSMKRKLKSIAQQVRADDYVTPGSLQLSHSHDFHLYTHLDRREKAQSSGGSSTHTSSSGTRHGGGGGKF